MLKVPEVGPVEEIREYRNSHLAAGLLWSHLFDKYIDPEKKSYVFRNNGKDLFALYDAPSRLTDYELDAFQLTFDGMILKAVDFPRAISAFRKVGADIEVLKPGLIGNHLLTIADDLENLKDVFAVCFIWTSVDGDAWYSERLDADGESHLMYDVSLDNKHWFAFSPEAP